jgi:hypothetical protein
MPEKNLEWFSAPTKSTANMFGSRLTRYNEHAVYGHPLKLQTKGPSTPRRAASKGRRDPARRSLRMTEGVATREGDGTHPGDVQRRSLRMTTGMGQSEHRVDCSGSRSATHSGIAAGDGVRAIHRCRVEKERKSNSAHWGRCVPDTLPVSLIVADSWVHVGDE